MLLIARILLPASFLLIQLNLFAAAESDYIAEAAWAIASTHNLWFGKFKKPSIIPGDHFRTTYINRFNQPEWHPTNEIPESTKEFLKAQNVGTAHIDFFDVYGAHVTTTPLAAEDDAALFNRVKDRLNPAARIIVARAILLCEYNPLGTLTLRLLAESGAVITDLELDHVSLLEPILTTARREHVELEQYLLFADSATLIPDTR